MDNPLVRELVLVVCDRDAKDLRVISSTQLKDKRFAFPMDLSRAKSWIFYDSSNHLLFDCRCFYVFVSSSINCIRQERSCFPKAAMDRTKGIFTRASPLRKDFLIETLSSSAVSISSPKHRTCKGGISGPMFI